MADIEHVCKPVERHVGSHHGHHPPSLVVDGHLVADHHHLTTALIEVWLAPVWLARSNDGGEPVALGIAVSLTTYLLASDAVTCTLGVWLKQVAFLCVIAGYERHTTAYQQPVVFDHLTDRIEHGIWLPESLFHDRHMIPHGHFHGGRYLLYLQAR